MSKLNLFITGLAAFVFISLAVPATPVQAASADLQSAISRLMENPRYRGKIISTHIRDRGGQPVLEVRILQSDDRIVIVYLDPKTGRVMGSSRGR